MAIDDEVVKFVREGLARGLSRGDLEGALLKAGWTREQVRGGLAGFADVDFPIPVPRPRPYLSARDGFMYAVMFGTLYLSAFNLGSVIFQLIDVAFPDPVEARAAEFTAAAIRWSVSSLIVAFPVFLFMSWQIGRGLRLDPTRRASRIRKQFTYLTLVFGAAILLGDVTTLVYNLLGGELTARFTLKVTTVAVIAGTIFGYYLRDLRVDEADGAT